MKWKQYVILLLRAVLRIFSADMTSPERVAIVHEWFASMRGGEKCVEALCEVYPNATLFALIHVKGSVSPVIERMPIRTSFIQRLPYASTHYRQYLPLFPTAVEQFDLSGYDLVISSNHCVAKGVRVPPGALHVCYCYTPMRYIWGMYDEYFGKGRAGLVTRLGMRSVLGYLRRWDLKTAANPRHFIAISENVRQRIQNIYGRTSDLIYPPVDTASLTLSSQDEGYYLIVSALVPYKRVDLAVAAFNRTGDRLVIAGDGPELGKLRAMAGPSVTLLGWQSDEAIRQLYAGCTAVLFPGEEDFGIVPVEAMACGKPVIAYAAGGALETVSEEETHRTGVLFPEQTPDSLIDALKRARNIAFDQQVLRSWALRFDRELYKQHMREYMERRWREFQR